MNLLTNSFFSFQAHLAHGDLTILKSEKLGLGILERMT